MTTSPDGGIVPPHITHPNDIRRHHLAAALRAKAQQVLDRSAQLDGPNGEVSVAATVLAGAPQPPATQPPTTTP